MIAPGFTDADLLGLIRQYPRGCPDRVIAAQCDESAATAALGRLTKAGAIRPVICRSIGTDNVLTVTRFAAVRR